MADQRVKGQDVFMIIEQDGQFKERIDAIQDCEITLDLEILKEAYLGEAGQRHDMIYNGVTLNMSIHHSNKQGILLGDAAAKRGQRVSGGLVSLNLGMVIVFPNGDLVQINVPNVQVGSFPFTVGGRAEYVSTKFEGAADGYAIVA